MLEGPEIAVRNHADYLAVRNHRDVPEAAIMHQRLIGSVMQVQKKRLEHRDHIGSPTPD